MKEQNMQFDLKNPESMEKFFELEGPELLLGDRKMIIKQRIMQRIVEREVCDLSLLIAELSAQTSPDAYTVARIRERVFAMIEHSGQRAFRLANFWFFNRKLVSFALLFVICFGIFSVFTVDTSVVRAGSLTTLSQFSGEVQIKRAGEKVVPQSEMFLQENDVLITGKDGFAVVNYFGDSFSRVAPDSAVVFSRLYLDKLSFETQVEVNIQRGTIWSKVANLINRNSKFSVRARDIVASTKKRSVLNVSVEAHQVEVNVYGNVAYVESLNKSEKVVSGYKAIVADSSIEVKAISENEKNDLWVLNNLEEDRELLIAAQAPVGESDEPGIRERALAFLTFDDVKKAKKELDLAEKDFISSQAKLSAGTDLSQVQAIFLKFDQVVNEFFIVIKGVESKDQNFAIELKNFVNEKLVYQKKSLSLVLANSPLYEAKELVNKLILENVPGEEFLGLRYENASDKLAEAQDLIVIGDAGKASEAIFAYKDQLDRVIDSVEVANEVGDLALLESNVEEDLTVLESFGDEKNEVSVAIAQVTAGLKSDLAGALAGPGLAVSAGLKSFEEGDEQGIGENGDEIKSDDVIGVGAVALEQESKTLKKFDLEVLEGGKVLPPGLGGF